MNEFISIEAAAALKGVSMQALYNIVQDDERRDSIFPGAVKHGEGKRGVWSLVREEVEKWQPRKYPRK